MNEQRLAPLGPKTDNEDIEGAVTAGENTAWNVAQSGELLGL